MSRPTLQDALDRLRELSRAIDRDRRDRKRGVIPAGCYGQALAGALLGVPIHVSPHLPTQPVYKRQLDTKLWHWRRFYPWRISKKWGRRYGMTEPVHVAVYGRQLFVSAELFAQIGAHTRDTQGNPTPCLSTPQSTCPRSPSTNCSPRSSVFRLRSNRRRSTSWASP